MEIPENLKHPSMTREEAFAELLHSIVAEETALSKLIHSEAKKNNAFVEKSLDSPTAPSNKEIIQYCQSLQSIVNSIHMKEWLLLQRLETVLLTSHRFTSSSKNGNTTDHN